MTHRIVWLDAEGEPSSDLLGGKGERLACDWETRHDFPKGELYHNHAWKNSRCWDLRSQHHVIYATFPLKRGVSS